MMELMAKTAMAAVAGVPDGTDGARTSQGGAAASIVASPRTSRTSVNPAGPATTARSIETSLSEWGTIHGDGARVRGAAGAAGCRHEGPRGNNESRAARGFDAGGRGTLFCGHHGTAVFRLANPTLGSGLHSKITPLLLRRLSQASRLRQ